MMSIQLEFKIYNFQFRISLYRMIAAAQILVSENIVNDNVSNIDYTTASTAGEDKKKLNWVSDRAIKAGAKARLLKKLFDNKVGTKTVEAMAATKVAERNNAEGVKSGRRRVGRGAKVPKEGCVRDERMVKKLIMISLKEARSHEKGLKKDFKQIRRKTVYKPCSNL